MEDIKMKKTVLISGASIAGLSMAYWMNHYGYKVTVVEIGPAPRMGGSPVDVRGEALDVAERMGILEKIKKAKVQTMGLEFVNNLGKVEGTMLVEEIGAVRPGDDIEIRRDDLVNILYANAQKDIEYRFNNRIKDIEQSEENVTVTFKDEKVEKYDFVIGADGIHSNVRKLVFGNEEQFTHFLNLYFSTFPVNGNLGKKDYAQIYTTPNNLALIYYYNDNYADGFLTFRSTEKIDYNYRDIQAQKKIVIDAFKGIGWKASQMIEELNKAENFYFDQVCQIKMSTWNNGRVALIGDAGYAAAFPTGMGSSLAMQGATVLADAMAENTDYKIAFQKYNHSFRPMVETMQATVYSGIDFLLPETQEKIDQRNKGTH